MSEASKAAVHRWVDEGINGGNESLIEELFAPNFVLHNGGRDMVMNGAMLKGWLRSNLTAFPDTIYTIGQVVASGDKVAWRWMMSGTQTGPLEGIPPTGRAVTFTGITLIRFEDGKFAEMWDNSDNMGLMQQLGLIPDELAI